MKSPSAFDLDLPKFSTASLSLPRRISVDLRRFHQSKFVYAHKVCSPCRLLIRLLRLLLLRWMQLSLVLVLFASWLVYSYSAIQSFSYASYFCLKTPRQPPLPALLLLLLLHYQHSLAASNHAFACKSAAHRWRNMPGICMQIYLHDATRLDIGLA